MFNMVLELKEFKRKELFKETASKKVKECVQALGIDIECLDQQVTDHSDGHH